MTNRIPLKWSDTRYNQTWENTAIKRFEKKAFTKYLSGGRDKNINHLIRLEKQKKQKTRVDFNSYLMDILDHATDLNAKQF